MFGTFSLEITLGNTAMQTREDVARALEAIAQRLRGLPPVHIDHGYVKDNNGNTVGSWQLTAEDDDE